MFNYQPLNTLPLDIQADFMATLQRYVSPTANGHFFLVDARRSGAKDWQSQRITVMVLDENGFPMPNVQVAFSYSTADQYILTLDFLWTPPSPPRAFIVPTGGGGVIDQIQGSVVRAGEPGGVTVYLFEPDFSSDVITGLGQLADHTGVIVTFQLRRNGVLSIADRIAELEERVKALEGPEWK
jgi:hypothetical protein